MQIKESVKIQKNNKTEHLMNTLMYDALINAGVKEEDAREAAIEAGRNDVRLTTFEYAMNQMQTEVISHTDTSIGKLQGRIAELKGQMAELKAYIDTSTSKLQGRIAELQGQIAELKGQIAELKGEVAELKGQIAELKAHVDTSIANASQRIINMMLITFGVSVGVLSLVMIIS